MIPEDNPHRINFKKIVIQLRFTLTNCWHRLIRLELGVGLGLG